MSSAAYETRDFDIHPLPAQASFANHVAVAAFIFFSTTPAFGVIGSVVGSALSLLGVMAFTVKPSKSAAISLILFLALIAPITIFDLAKSMNDRFTTLSFIDMPLSVMMGFILSQSTSRSDFIDVFERVFLWIALPSMMIYLIFLANPDIAYSFPEYKFRDVFDRTAIFLNVRMDPDPVLRNAGFSSEPGFYEILVNSALYARLRRLRRAEIGSMFYVAVSISTASTAGMVVSAILLATKLNNRYRILLAALAFAFLDVIEEVAETHWTTKIANEAVFGPRFLPSINALHMFFANPLGIGAVEYQRIYEAYDIGSWDAYTQICLRYGLPGLVAFSFLMFNVARRYLVLALVFGLSFFTSPIWFLPTISAFFFPSPREAGPHFKKPKNPNFPDE